MEPIWGGQQIAVGLKASQEKGAVLWQNTWALFGSKEKLLNIQTEPSQIFRNTASILLYNFSDNIQYWTNNKHLHHD